jgi:hypothetical protein
MASSFVTVCEAQEKPAVDEQLSASCVLRQTAALGLGLLQIFEAGISRRARSEACNLQLRWTV